MIGPITFAVVLGLLLIGVLRSPAAAAAGILCLFGLEQWGLNSSPWLVQHGQFTNIAIGTLVLLGLTIRVLRGECLLCVPNRVAVLVFTLYAVAFCSLLWGPDIAVGLSQWQKSTPYLATTILLVPLLIRDVHDVRRSIEWTIGIGTLLCILALMFGRWGHRGLLVLGDLYSMETNPLAIASMAGTVFVAAMLSFNQHGNLKWRLLLLIAVPAALAVMLKSGSRGQLIAACFAAAVAWPLAYPQRKGMLSLFIWPGVLTLIAAVGWWVAGAVEIDTARWETDQTAADVSGRLDSGLLMIERASNSILTLLFGLGNSSSISYLGYYPHVTFLEVLAEEGIVGFALYAGILGLTAGEVSTLLAKLHKNSDPSGRSWVTVVSALFLFELILTFKQGTLLSNQYVFAYAIILARLQKLVAEHTATTASVAPVLRPLTNVLR